MLCDIGLPGQSGLELLDELGRTRPDIATVMVSGHDHTGIVDAALALGAYGYVTKPFTANELMIDISNALHRRRYEAERREAADSALQRAYAGTLSRLSRAVEYHDGATGSHLERVGTYTADDRGRARPSRGAGRAVAACGAAARHRQDRDRRPDPAQDRDAHRRRARAHGAAHRHRARPARRLRQRAPRACRDDRVDASRALGRERLPARPRRRRDPARGSHRGRRRRLRRALERSALPAAALGRRGAVLDRRRLGTAFDPDVVDAFVRSLEAVAA